MNFRSEQFRSLADRQKEADLCRYYGKVNLPAVKAAKAVSKSEKKPEHASFVPKLD